MIEFQIPNLHLIAEQGNEMPKVRARRARNQRELGYLHAIKAINSASARDLPDFPLLVTITRIAPRELDQGDNEQSSGKHVRDGIADALGINDRDKRVTWVVTQEREDPKFYAVRVRIEPRLAKRFTCEKCGHTQEEKE